MGRREYFVAVFFEVKIHPYFDKLLIFKSDVVKGRDFGWGRGVVSVFGTWDKCKELDQRRGCNKS